jgi:hypothetical protein
VPSTASVQKAELRVIETKTSIKCWFNPSTLKLSRIASWQTRPVARQAAPNTTYLGGKPEVLQLELLLHAQYGQSGTDVQSAIDQLFALLDPTCNVKGAPEGTKRPPTVQFSWGQYVSFDAICESVTVNEELFDVDGSPLRASVTLQLRQREPEPGQATPPGQNPTTRAVLANRSHTIRYGDSLASIAYKHYGDPTRWREIGEANDIDDPLRLVPGNALVVRVVDA